MAGVGLKSNDMSNLRIKLQALCFALLFGVITASAQVEIRYVSTNGNNSNSGLSWADAKKDIQDAINSLVTNNKTGEVWVQEGTYYPTEATETSGSQYYRAFKIPAGITVRGGFKGDETSASQREMENDANFGKAGKSGNLDGEEAKSGKYKYKTILCGDLSKDKVGKLTFNKDLQQFDCTFYGNSYHVVWFAMNGFTNGRANPLTKPAKLEGCIVKGGHAYHLDVNANHPHEAYGGGIYMVANSFVYNCEVHDCDASRNGGGIYMDGGGIVRRSYVHDCQTLGLGTEYGMGGGICEDGAKHNSKANPVVVAQSAVTNCVGRIGGGIALLADQTVGNNKYAVVINSTVVNNNTAQIEAGGVYTYKGGGVASATIVTNKCNGSGITQNGVITGRSGGLYSRDAAYVGNTVIWGNECEANKNIQYAASRSNLSNTEKSRFYHNALSNADLADWSLAEKMNVMSLESVNDNPSGEKTNMGFPLFFKPTTDKGYVENYSTEWGINEETGVWTGNGYNWNVYSESALTNAGINTADLDNEGLTPAPTGKSYDMYFDAFNARPTIGALAAETVSIAPKQTKDGSAKVIKEEYYVDPDYIYTTNNPGTNGADWDQPVRFLGNVLDRILNEQAGRATGDKEIIIYVKEGTVDNTRPANDADRVRTTPLDIPSNVTILGSFDRSLTGTDISRRNPIHTPTIISAKLMDDYKYNIAHLINIDGKENITIDGFKLTFANANSTELTNDNKNGAAITLKNCQKHDGDSSPNIHFRNITVSNCFGDKGTVVFADNASADFENCIFHNNTTATLANSGLIYGINKSDLRFNHCDVVRNVGHASYLDAETYNTWDNSIFYGNMDRALTDTNVDAGGGIGYALAAFSGTTAHATGSRCMFDEKSASFASQFGGNDTGNKWQYNLQYAFVDGTGQGYPRFINPTKNSGYTIDGNSTYYGRAVSYEPHNNNPVVNTAGTGGEDHITRRWGTDITTIITRDFGGLPDIGAVESHLPTVDEVGYENANHDGQMPYGVAYYVRDYAQTGMPATYVKTGTDTYTEQTGADKGKGNYVKEGSNYVFLDGASWQYAVSGNANYGEGVPKDVNAVFYAKEKTPGSTKYETFTIRNVNRTSSYLYITNTGALGLTTTAGNAAKWTVSNTTTENGTFAAGTHTVSTTVGGNTYYLSFSGSNPTISKNKAANVYIVTAVTTTNSNSRIRTQNKTYYYYNANSSTSLTGTTSTTSNNSNWTFVKQETHIDPTYEEAHEPSDADENGNVAQSDKVATPMKLHVYKTLNDFKTLNGKGLATTYKIGQFEPSSETAAGYVSINNTTNYYAVASASQTDGHTFALIASNTENQYYIYDVTTSRYVYYYNNTSTPVRETATESSRTPWYIVQSATDGRFNIARASGSAVPTNGWNKGATYITLDANTGNSAQWILIAQNGYTQYKKTILPEGYINGLQYAVNTVHDEFKSTGVQHEVHVAKGEYTNATAADGDKTVQQPYAYMMKEGVNVLGGYPTVGNPGEEQRQPKEFETILQPKKQNPYITMSFVAESANSTLPGSSGGAQKHFDAMKVTEWGDFVTNTNTNDKASTGRVLIQPVPFSTQTTWDGFTIQHGYLNTAYTDNIGTELVKLTADKVKTAGGAGTLLQDNGNLVNCVVKDNLILCSPKNTVMTITGTNATYGTYSIHTYHIGGAGIFMTGDASGATVENCEIANNQLIMKSVNEYISGDTYVPNSMWMYGAGLFQNGGNVYNTIIHDNDATTLEDLTLNGKVNPGGNTANDDNEMILGGGAFIAKGNFYNNTIVNNLSCTYFHRHYNHCSFGGVHVFQEANIYNSIIADNQAHWAYETWGYGTSPGHGVPVSAFDDKVSGRTSRNADKVHVTYSFVDVNKGAKESDGVLIDLVSKNDTKNTNIYLNVAQGGSAKTITTADVYYQAGGASTTDKNRYHLVMGVKNSPAINAGLSPIPNADIPDFDADYTDRIKDCKIDIGAYESDGSATIKPQTVGADQLVFYVTPEGYGKTSGEDPLNAACAAKLQKVLDAAGRQKLLNPGKQVIVKVANSYDLLHPANVDEHGDPLDPSSPDYVDPSNFTYYATRTTDANDQDVRMWSIMIPRGVEVWGGYTDVAASEVSKDPAQRVWNNTTNGFVTRDITKNPTYFDSYYYNKDQKSNATTYHVVTFTERVYDVNGMPYKKTDYSEGVLAEYSSYTGGIIDESQLLHMSDVIGTTNVIMEDATHPKKIDGKTVSNRAVLDGIFVTGGNANGATIAGSSNLNAHSYGGGAIVTDYAYVRNCIVMDNSATNGGGLALTNGALVSGSLIIENNADNSGGGLYVFENGATLSNGIKINSDAPEGQVMDYNMAHVITTTIAGNTAQHGGGVWFTSDPDAANARFNSVAIWQNEAPDQTNVFGAVNPEQPTEDETDSEVFYPFAYSLIQNVRASGTNNLSAENLNNQGLRFVDKNHDFGTTDEHGVSTKDLTKMAVEQNSQDIDVKLSNFGYYGLTTYSILCSNGMPVRMYNQLKDAIAISDVDILNTLRIDPLGNKFVEIGARALPFEMPKKQLMLRLFVANPGDVDAATAVRFMNLSGTAGSEDEYYSQIGSSFAYPFNSLQDALDYVRDARNGKITGNTEPMNLPFEILVGKGYHYPKKDLNGETISVWAHTFAIPEGVTVIGGFDPQGGGGTATEAYYYGRYYAPKASISTEQGDIYDNVNVITPNSTVTPGGTEIGRGNPFGTDEVTLPATPAVGTVDQPGYVAAALAKTITFQRWHIEDIADRRAMYDNNKNGIIEPWEFKNQTVISGNAVNGETDGVYHIMTAVADADAVGNLPKVQDTNGSFNVAETGYQWKEQGQQIRLNGLVITGGNALTYLSTALDEYGKYIFYQGAGLQVDGNRYKPTTTSGDPVFHNSAAYGVGYRDIPVSITNCQFRNNVAGYGGAISSNGSLSIFASSFEQNMAIAQTETPEPGKEDEWFTMISGTKQLVSKVMYPGQGGAIHASGQLSAFNTLFANNEARLADGETVEGVTTAVKHPTFRVPVEANASATLRAAGGAIMMGSAGNHHIVNCDFVRNKANAYPAVFTMNPTYDQNNPDAPDYNPNKEVLTHYYSQIINTVAWGNEVNPAMLAKYGGNASYKFASKLLVNVGKKNRTVNYITSKTANDFYDPQFSVNGNAPESQEDLDGATGNWQEATWFSAYENGVGFTPNNTNDLRTSIIYRADRYAPDMIKAANGGSYDAEGNITSVGTYQNCNILIVANNDDIAGPNFGSPSFKAGYDGFMEGADWSPARFNRLTDNGNGWIEQSVDPATLDVTFNDKAGKGHYQGAYPVTHYISDLTDDHQFPEYKLWLALGSEKYMQATKDQEKQDVTINGTTITPRPQKNLPRISADPTIGVEKAYIDIGVYEYIKQPLLLPGSEVDVLWVSTKENPKYGPADGLTWRTPTSDLQRAIETLLQSRNGHKKEIRIMEGEYSPVTLHEVAGTGSTTTKYQSFYINTEKLNKSVITPSALTGDVNTDYYAQSLTIKGGYSSNIEYAYDPDKYKVVIRQAEAPAGINTDHLIFIDDATVRYAWKDYKDPEDAEKTKAAYNADNNYGAWKKDQKDEHATTDDKTAHTMPIQIDGVTLINDKAAANAQGAAIYYKDAPTDVTKASNVQVGSKVTYYTTKDKTAVSTKETDFFTTKQYYHYETIEGEEKKVDNNPNIPTPDHADWCDETGSVMENPSKLVIAKTQVIGSGNKSDNIASASAVYIGQYGGNALIYNTVFHSNYGMPLVAYNTVNVNNTFGLNGGKVQLYATSSMHNSALWKNNKGGATGGATYGDQIHFGASFPGLNNSAFTYNSFTGCTHDGDQDETHKWNTNLVDENKNLAKGPNFVDPENEDIEARSFDLKPSVRLLNKGNGTRTVNTPPAADTYAGTYADQVVNAPCAGGAKANYDYSLVPAVDKDVASRARIIGNDSPKKIDIGAYEFQGNLMQVLYVDPNKMHSADATGENWDKSFGYGDLQDAMDLAAIYHLMTPAEEAYVFVKGASSTNKNLHTEESLIIRDGVTTYGSIVSSYTNWHDMQDPEHPEQKKYDGIDKYIEDMKSDREGVASSTASKTTVSGIKTDDGSYDGKYGSSNTPALVDGFVVKPVDADHQPTAPVLDITNTSANATIVVRNVIVADNDLSGATDPNANVAQISNGLIYEVLMRDNKPKGSGAVLKVSNGQNNTKGYAVNVTVEGKTVGADGQSPVDGMNAEGTLNIESSTQIYKSITNSIGAGKGKAAGKEAPYGAITNKHISGYFYNIDDANLNFQLTETSKYINTCDAVNPLTGVADKLAQFINYQTDRDILGNPRVLADVNDGKKIAANEYKLDRGAFETWKVMIHETGKERGFRCGSDGTIAQNFDYKTTSMAEGLDKIKLENIKKHFYPHDGSVCYIMEGMGLVIDAYNPATEVKPTPHNPGYMLVQKDASFYGNGRPATCAYVAIEREVHKDGTILAIPYTMQYNTNVSKPKYADGILNELDGDVVNAAYEYSGTQRSEWNYIFQTANTQCWGVIDKEKTTDANHGVLFNAKEAAFDLKQNHKDEHDREALVLLRFTGKGANLTDYVYTEQGVSKTVELTRYDDAESTNAGADYTDVLDMGWNCFGLPYLVSEYKPYQKVTADEEHNTVVTDENGTYTMDTPHELWLYYYTPVYPAPDPLHPDEPLDPESYVGSYNAVNSWSENDGDWHTDNKSIWVGEGMFTQTAVIDDTEPLLFYRPIAPASFFVNATDPAKSVRTVRIYTGVTGIEEKEMTDSIELIGVEYYTVDGIRIEKPRRGAVTIIRKLYSNGASSTSKQFVK